MSHQFIRSALFDMRDVFASGQSQRAVEYRRIFMPYCLQAVGDSVILLNRLYKPIGVSLRDHVDYAAPEFEYARIRLDQVCEGARHYIEEFGVCYLYTDRTSPAYAQNLRTYFDTVDRFIRLDLI